MTQVSSLTARLCSHQNPPLLWPKSRTRRSSIPTVSSTNIKRSRLNRDSGTYNIYLTNHTGMLGMSNGQGATWPYSKSCANTSWNTIRPVLSGTLRWEWSQQQTRSTPLTFCRVSQLNSTRHPLAQQHQQQAVPLLHRPRPRLLHLLHLPRPQPQLPRPVASARSSRISTAVKVSRRASGRLTRAK